MKTAYFLSVCVIAFSYSCNKDKYYSDIRGNYEGQSGFKTEGEGSFTMIDYNPAITEIENGTFLINEPTHDIYENIELNVKGSKLIIEKYDLQYAYTPETGMPEPTTYYDYTIKGEGTYNPENSTIELTLDITDNNASINQMKEGYILISKM